MHTRSLPVAARGMIYLLRPRGSARECQELPTTGQPSAYGDDEPLQVASLERQEKVQLMFCIEEFFDDLKKLLLVR
jgi:hypothetical protein